jgi:hypothetical protein
MHIYFTGISYHLSFRTASFDHSKANYSFSAIVSWDLVKLNKYIQTIFTTTPER